MLRAFVPATLALLLLAGCASKGTQTTDPGAATLDNAVGSAQANAKAAPSAPAGNGTAPGKPQPSTETYDGTWAGGVNAPVARDAEFSGKRPYELTLDGTEAGVVVEMKWTASTPASDAMGLAFRIPGKTDHGTAGAGPMLRVALTGLEAGNYVAYARASGPNDAAGAFVTQDYTIWVTVFPAGSAFDPNFTAAT